MRRYGTREHRHAISCRGHQATRCLSRLPDDQARDGIKVVIIGDKAGEPETFHDSHRHSIIRQQAVVDGDVRSTCQKIERHWFDVQRQCLDQHRHSAVRAESSNAFPVTLQPVRQAPMVQLILLDSLCSHHLGYRFSDDDG